MRVFFYEAFEEEESALRRHLDPSIDARYTWKSIQEHGAQEPPATVISIRTQSQLPLQWACSLGGILSRSTGYDHLVQYRDDGGTGVSLGYLPHYCVRAVAEQAMLHWMSLLRKLGAQVAGFQAFSRDGLTGLECAGRTLLVVGVGNIGREIVSIGTALGMTVRGVDLEHRHEEVEYIDIEEGLAWADVIVSAMNLTPENRGYFSPARMAGVKPGAVFINVGRGEVSPHGVLHTALQEGHLGGVGLDVYNEEVDLSTALRDGKQTELVGEIMSLAALPNVLLTPHNAFNTVESVERKSADAACQLLHFMNEGCFRWTAPGAGD